MPTIINNPTPSTDNSSGGLGTGLILGIIVAIIIIFLAVVYGRGVFHGSTAGSGNQSNPGTTVNVPDKINVDVNKTGN